MKTLFNIEPGYEALLRSAGLDSFDALMAVRGGPPASRHRHRETIPLDITFNGELRRFFLKRVFKVPPRHAVAPLLRFEENPSQPRREWTVLGRLANLPDGSAVPAMRRIAVGEQRRMGLPNAALLLVERVESDWTLEHWLVPGFDRPKAESFAMRRLPYELGLLIGRMHGYGIRWPDMVAKHIFAAPTGNTRLGTAWQFRLIDVERMHVPRIRPGKRKRAWIEFAALGELLELRDSLEPASFDRRGIARFLAGYARGYSMIRPGAARVRLRFPLYGWANRQFRERPRLPDDYVHPRSDPFETNGQMRGTASGLVRLKELGITGVEAALRSSEGTSLRKPGLEPHRDRVRLSVGDADTAEVLYLKRYRRPPVKEQLARMREADRDHSTAYREWKRMTCLSALGIPTARPIAFGEQMIGTWEQASFLAMEAVPGESLEKYVARVIQDPTSRPAFLQRREIIRQLALLVRHLHGNDFFHRDLYLSHVFLTQDAQSRVVLRLIDLARMLHRPWRRRRWINKDLAALEYSAPAPLVTRSDRLRFLYLYAFDYDPARSPPGAADRPDWPASRRRDGWKASAREWIRAIQLRANRMARHDQSRSMRVAGNK